MRPDMPETYAKMYQHPEYRMRQWRRDALSVYLTRNMPSNILDVGCGRGESLKVARECGVVIAHGCEIVESLCGPQVTYLPEGAVKLPFRDNHYQMVVCMDVLEHLEPEEVPLAIQELRRVAAWKMFVSVPHKQERNGLHLTVEPREWWIDQLSKVGEVEVIDLPVPEIKQPYTFFEIR